MHAIRSSIDAAAACCSGTGAMAACAVLPKVLFANTGGSGRLVVVILRGALDGLAAVPPHGDPDYARPASRVGDRTAGCAGCGDARLGRHRTRARRHLRLASLARIPARALRSPVS